MNKGLNFKILKMSPALFAWRYTESVTYQTYHFADVFVRENVAYGYGVRKYTADEILFREIQCKKMDNNKAI